MKNLYLLFCLLFAGGLYAQNNTPGNNNAPEPTEDYDYPNDYRSDTTLILNFTREITPLQPATSDPALNSLRQLGARTVERTTYTDGLGRPVQVVVKKPVANLTRDLVKHYNYDAFGNITQDLLVYASSNTSFAGENKFNRRIFSDLASTYTTRLQYTDEHFRFQKTIREESPRAMVQQTLAPGNSWVGSNRSVTHSVRANISGDQVRLWQIALSQDSLPRSPRVYLPGELTVKSVVDEDAKESLSFYDLEGRLVMTDLGGGASRIYYVYDVYGRMRYTIPALALESIGSANWVVSQSISDNLCFVTQYDDRGRTASIKKPGIGKTIFRYNDRGEVLFSQDAVQRSKNEWIFYKYDIMGRVIQQGTYSGQLVFSTTGNGLVDYVYSDNVKTHADYQYSFSDTKFYIHFYFDNYAFIADYLKNVKGYNESKLDYSTVVGASTEGLNKDKSNQTKGLLTGVYTLTSSASEKWVARVNYYNSEEEVIQSIQEDLYGDFNTTAMGYDFAGRMIKTVYQDQVITVQKKYVYDAYGRIKYIDQKLGSASVFRRIAEYSYDDIGRLKQKSLGSMNHAVKYEYNIRNWITGINKQYCYDKSTNLFFGMEISYEYGFQTNYLNGNIAGVKWRNAGTSGDLRSYGYTYDGQSRLIDATYRQWDTDNKPDEPDWSNSSKDFTTENISYDANGNLLSMRHQGLGAAGNKITLDDLTYTYQSGTNKLQSVSEGGAMESADPAIHDQLGDFRDVAGTDYTYDANGNLASDQNREVHEIKANWFTVNKPLEVNQKPNGMNCKVTYVYDALGNLLQKRADWGVSGNENTKIFDYYGNLVYENRKPVLVLHEEGRVRIETDSATQVRTYYYDYFIRDHIENVRSVLTEKSYDLVDEAGDPGTYDPNVSPANPLNAAPVGYIATSEIQNDAWEASLFNRIGDTRDTRPLPTDPEDAFAALLNAPQGKVLGPGKMIKVMAGDRVQLGAESYFRSGANPEQPIPMQAMVETIINAICNTAPVSADGNGPFSGAMFDAVSLTMALDQIQNNTTDTTLPRAYLNFLLFDQNFNVVPEYSGAIQVEHADAWTPMDVSRFDIPVSGFLYVFTSNQSAIDVHTDNLYLLHWKGSLEEELHYYPFGLTFDVNKANPNNRTNSKFNSQSFEQLEFKDASDNPFGLDWYDFMARSYDPQIGRWMQPDPLMQYGSPYLAMGNSPVMITDPTGLWGVDGITLSTLVVRPQGNYIEGETTYEKLWRFSNNAGGGGTPGGFGVKYALTATESHYYNQSRPTQMNAKIDYDQIGLAFNVVGSMTSLLEASYTYDKSTEVFKYGMRKASGKVVSAAVLTRANSINAGKMISLAKGAGTILGVAGIGLTVLDGADNGFENHHYADMGIQGAMLGAALFAVPGVGWVAGAYFVADLAWRANNDGKSITESIFDED